MYAVFKRVGVNKGGWFEAVLVHRVDDGESSSLWHDLWFEGRLLHVRFNRLFYLYVIQNKESSIAQLLKVHS